MVSSDCEETADGPAELRCGAICRATVVAGIYFVFAVAWILWSDAVVERLSTDAASLSRLQTGKGLFYVLITALGAWWGVWWAMRSIIHSHRERVRQDRHFRQIFDGIADPTLVYPLARPGESGRFEVANRAAEERLGWSRADLLGMSPPRLLSDGFQQTWCDFESALVRDGFARASCTLRRSDHRPIEVEVYGHRQDIEGRMLVIITARDLAARRSAEARLLEAERLAAAGIIAAGLAHEFNNLHAIVSGETESLLAEAEGEQRQPLMRIEAAIRRASGITSGLLALSRRDPGCRRVRPLQRVLDDTVTIIAGQMKSEGVELLVEHEPAPPAEIDPHQIGQVALNLLVNAWHATRGCALRRVELRSGVSGDAVFFSVRDSGCGMDAETLEHIFIPFHSRKGAWAAAGSPQAELSGNGLGLSLCKALVDHHGGNITITSCEGEGSQATVHLPVSDKASASTGQQPVVTKPARTARIAVVDDEPMLRRMLRELLQSVGHQVLDSDDGAEALAWCARGEVEVMLLDSRMPKMSGLEVLRRLALQGGRPPAVILISGWPGEIADLPLPLAGQISKPFRLGEITQAIDEALHARSKATH